MLLINYSTIQEWFVATINRLSGEIAETKKVPKYSVIFVNKCKQSKYVNCKDTTLFNIEIIGFIKNY